MKLKKISILFVLLIVNTVLFCACSTKKPYIEVVNLKTTYYIDEELDLSSSKIHYYGSGNGSDYEEIELTSDMITNFSTEEVGTFTMTITYNNISKQVEYSVRVMPISVTESEAKEIISQTLTNMSTLSEVKETISVSFWGITQTSYKITTQNKQYYFEDTKNQSWMLYENNDWKRYEISYDVFDEVMEYKEFDVQNESNNLIDFEYSNIISETPFGEPVFIEAYKSDNEYVVTFYIENLNETYIEFIISDNKLMSQTSYNLNGNNKTIIGTSTYSYNQGEINSIPEIPNKNWEYGGFYFELN